MGVSAGKGFAALRGVCPGLAGGGSPDAAEAPHLGSGALSPLLRRPECAGT
ncbi:hypothetical protein ACF07Q_04520 [Nocardiopsis dassonvillei]|uniref:hypothetical protein n=1 Tax=Nocardiopsis dassonvillei TaxID=2014 RepID=UPI0036F5D2E3